MFDMNEFAIRMWHKKFDFKSWTVPETLLVSLLKKVRVQNFEIINFPKDLTFFV